MKIVFFSSDNNITSGAFRAEVNLINDLREKGHDITLVVPYKGTGRKLIKKYNIKSKTIFSVFWVCLHPKTIIDFIFYWMTWPINKIASMRTRKFLKNNTFDLAAINTVWNGIGANEANKLSIPVVWHFREMLERGEHRTFYNKKKSIDLISKSKIILPVSKSVKDFYIKDFPNNEFKVIYDGVDVNKFYYENTRLFTDKTVHLIMVGRIYKEKGQDLAIKALKQLKQYDFDITFVGYGYPSYIKKLTKQGECIKDRMHFVGPTNDVNQYYRKADLFLMNTIGEAFGLVTAEAMLNGLSVIAAKCDGPLEIIDNEENGYFYEPLNVFDLKNKIEYVFLNKEEAIEKAKKGQTRVKNTFSREKNCKEIERVYLNVINKQL